MRFNFTDNKPYFYSSLFFAVLLLFAVLIKLAFSWNSPTAGSPNPAGQTLYSDSSNNIGIGTLYPGAKLEVFSTSSDSVIKLSRGPGSSTSTIFKLGTDTAFIINNQSTDVLTIKSGNVGIGTTTPSEKLHILGDNVTLKIQSVTPAVETTIFSGFSGGLNRSTIFTTGAMLSFGASGSTVMSIVSNGNVGIGILDPAANLTVKGVNSVGTEGLRIESDTGAYRNIYLGAGDDLYFASADDVAYLTTAGVWTNASDIAYKTNIKDMAKYGLNTVLQIKPREYQMKSDLTPQIGFIAQDMEKIIPEVVSGKEGNKGISYGQLTSVLAKAIQEQQEQIEQLKIENDLFKAENEALKKRIEILEMK